jgi:phospholipid-binding lipoprotein MlaA
MPSKSKIYTLCIILLGLLLFSGCARKTEDGSGPNLVGKEAVTQGDAMDLLLDDDFYDDENIPEVEYYDPLEPMNRVFFELNDKLYYWILSPANTAYTAVLPIEIRYSLGNFVANLASPIRFVNSLLQLKFSDAGAVLSRFVINSTLGVYGFGDAAMVEFEIMPRDEDFGQTLGYWGVGEGLYLCLPVIGPSSVRDGIGFAGDVYTHPMVYFVDDLWVSGGYYVASRVNLLSLNPDIYEDLKKYSLDPYVSMRQVYLDYRRKKIVGTASPSQSENEW